MSLPIIDIVDKLPRRPDMAWATRPLTAITGISIHHSADEASPETWARYHTTPPEQGGPPWGPAPGVAYHYAVMRDGTIYKLNLDRHVTWHTAGHNTSLLGVVLQGNLVQRPATREQIVNLVRLVAHLLWAYPTIQPENIRGHGEWAGQQTECPGQPALVAAVRALFVPAIPK